MGLLRKKDAGEKKQAAPPRPSETYDPVGSQEKKPAGNLFVRFKNYLIDSYNGLYKIFLSGYVPKGKTFQLVFLGLVIGLFWGYILNPVQFYNADPSQMSQSARDQWIKLVAGSAYAGMYNDEGVRLLLEQVENPAANIARLEQAATPGTIEKQALLQISPLAQNLQGKPAPVPTPFLASVIQLIIPFVVVAVLMVVLNLAWKVLLYQYVWFPITDAIRSRTDAQYAEEKRKRQEEFKAIQERRKRQESMAAQVDVDLGEPLTKRLSVYTKGRGYDDSFEIEGHSDVPGVPGDFLGECGASIGSRDDNGDPNAIEVWMFELATQETLTKFFVPPSAANDPALRAKLEPRVKNPASDIMATSPGAKLSIDGQTLKLQATVSTAQYNPTNTGFENLELQIFTWQLGAERVAATPGLPPMQAATSFAPPAPRPQDPFAPPRQQQPLQPLQPPPIQQQAPQPLQPLQPPPLRPQQPSPFGQPQRQPLQPPPMQYESDEVEDDPFGGTGDFTPLGGN